MIGHVVTNWKISMLGILAGLMVLIGSTLQAREIDPATPPVTLANILPAVAIAALGLSAKDADKSNALTPGPAQTLK